MKCNNCGGSGRWRDPSGPFEQCLICLGTGDTEEGRKRHRELELDQQISWCESVAREPVYCWQRYPEAAAFLGIPQPADVRDGKYICSCCSVPFKYCEYR
jgi:hypothetical protein